MDAASKAAALAQELGPLLLQCPEPVRPHLIASLERLAAGRYATWAASASSPAVATGLRACAEREREIAARIERDIPAPAAMPDFGALLGDASSRYEGAFTGLSDADAYALQAALERVGATTWRSFAASATDRALQTLFLECAALEEASARCLDELGASPQR